MVEWDVMYTTDVIDNIDIVRITPMINLILSIPAWRDYTIRSSGTTAIDIYNKIMSNTYDLSRVRRTQTMIFTVLLSWLILKQLDPHRAWEIRVSDIVIGGSRMPFLRSGRKLVLPTALYVVTIDLNQAFDSSTLLCTANDMFYGFKTNTIIPTYRSLIDELVYRKIDVEEAVQLADELLAPNSDYRDIASKAMKNISNTQASAVIIYKISNMVFDIKLLRIFNIFIEKERPPGCVSNSSGMKYPSSFRDIYTK